jgi:hypothetical protein
METPVEAVLSTGSLMVNLAQAAISTDGGIAR